MGEAVKLPRAWRRSRLVLAVACLLVANVGYFLSAVCLGLHKLLDAFSDRADTRATELEAE